MFSSDGEMLPCKDKTALLQLIENTEGRAVYVRTDTNTNQIH